jgi:hypothetical protein
MKHRFAILAIALAVSACSKGHVETVASVPTAPLPPPAHVIVADFSINAGDVRLDSGVGGLLRRQVSGQDDTSAAAQSAQEAQAALADTLTRKLIAYGLPAERLPAGVAPRPGSLLVQGQIDSVNQGNRTRRTLIGLGAGKSSVTADAQLYYVADAAAPQFLQALTGTADSGHMPGAAETMGAGAAADRVATSAALTAATHAGSEIYKTGDAANAAKLADALARQIGNYAVQQGWIPASAVQ